MIAVPLSRLRVMPPQGAPVVWTRGDGSLRIGLYLTRDTVIALDPNGWVRMTELGDRERDSLALDLAAPTTDRIDGADVAARMLAQAAGLDVSRGVKWTPMRGLGRIGVDLHARDRDGYPKSIALPAPSEPLMSDAADPRDILAAVLLAVLGAE